MAENWTLEDGLKLVRAIQPETRKFGYHLTMGGSVLNNGDSEKDLDLYFLPLGNHKVKEDPTGLVDWLKGLWGQPDPIGEDYDDDGPAHLDEDAPFAPQVLNAPAYRAPGADRPPQFLNVPFNAQVVNPHAIRAADLDEAMIAARERERAIRIRDVVLPAQRLRMDAQGNVEAYYDDLYEKPKKKAIPPPNAQSVYKYKLMFVRGNGDRIDVFIL